MHSKYFKKVVTKDLGIGASIFSKASHVISDSLLAELLFTLVFSPSTPYLVDNTSVYLEFL